MTGIGTNTAAITLFLVYVDYFSDHFIPSVLESCCSCLSGIRIVCFSSKVCGLNHIFKESEKMVNIRIIDKCPVFSGMTDEEREKCLSSLDSNEKAFRKNSYLMRAGDVTDRMGIVMSGSVTVESNDIWGNRTILSIVEERQVFAETYALLPDEIMLVDVRANENCRILFLSIRNVFKEPSKESWKNKILKNLLMIYSQKNLHLSGRSFHTSSKSCRGRLLSYLNSVSLRENSNEFDIPFNRQQLADYLNLERTNMSKELAKMQKDRIIEYHLNHFKLITPVMMS